MYNTDLLAVALEWDKQVILNLDCVHCERQWLKRGHLGCLDCLPVPKRWQRICRKCLSVLYSDVPWYRHVSRSVPALAGSLGWPYGSDWIPRPLTHDVAIGRIKQHFYSCRVGELPLQLGNMGTIINPWNRCKLYRFWSRYHCMDVRTVPFWSQTSWYDNQSFYFIHIFKVYHLMEEIEVVVRCHLNKDAMHTYVPGTDTKSDINTGYLGPYSFFTWISTRATTYQG